MAVRLANEQDKRAYYTMLSYCFNMGNHNIENQVANSSFPADEIILNEIDGNVCQCTHVIPYNISFDGKIAKMGGIGGVSSLPEYRDFGGIKDILTYSLSYMKERGMVFSALGPFSFEFYRKYGWEWVFNFQKLKFSVNDLKNSPKAHKYLSLNKEHDELVNDFRNDFIKNINGPVYFDEKIRKERWEKCYNQFIHCYAALDENNKVEAIAYFKIENRVLICDEFFFKNETGRQHMLHLFYTHRSQVDHIELQLLKDDNIRVVLPTPRIQNWEWPNMMFRIVDVKQAIELMKANNIKGSFKIKVIDKQAEWNNKIFKVSIDKNEINVTPIENTKTYDFETTIQRLSQLVIGFVDGNEAIKLEIVKVNNDKKIDLFNQFFTRRPNMIWHPF